MDLSMAGALAAAYDFTLGIRHNERSITNAQNKDKTDDLLILFIDKSSL